jgi:EmrB/QacA subfamily drug resistance transporter
MGGVAVATASTEQTHATADRRRWLGLFFVALGVALIIVDTTIVNVAIPTIIEDLQISSSQAQWVQEAYTLVFAALLLVFGRLADRWGRRLLFLIGVIIFIAASVWAAVAGSGFELISARLAQGLGGALILPTSLSIINANFRGRDRAVAFAVWGSTIGGTAALGPLLGGYLTTSLSWRWAFGINIPLGLLVFIGTLIFVAESKDRSAAKGIDISGAILSVLGIGLIVFALIEGRVYGWFLTLGQPSLLGVNWPLPVSPVFVALALGMFILMVFALVEVRRNRQGRTVLMDLSLFRIPSFRNGNIAAGIVSLGEFGLLFALPFWLQNVLGYSAFNTGTILLALALGSFLASGLGVQLNRARGPVFVVRTGIVLEIIGIIGIGLVISPDAAIWAVVGFLFIYGLGVGMATAQLTGVVLADVPVAASGQGSGIQSTTRQVGSALGIAILGTVLFTGLGTSLNNTLSADPNIPDEVREQTVSTVVTTAGAVIPALREDPATTAVAEAAGESLSKATSWAAFVAAGFLMVGLLASFSLSTPPGKLFNPEDDSVLTDDAPTSQ